MNREIIKYIILSVFMVFIFYPFCIPYLFFMKRFSKNEIIRGVCGEYIAISHLLLKAIFQYDKDLCAEAIDKMIECELTIKYEKQSDCKALEKLSDPK